jgi:HNH endonuclease
VNGRPWTARETAMVRELYPRTSTAEVARRLGRTVEAVYNCAHDLGLRKTPEYLASPDACRLRRGDNVGAAYRFPKGHVPANKGLRRPGYGPGRMKETQFKKGNVSKRWDPELYCIGGLRINANGYVDMKVCKARGALAWRALHVLLWEDEHGPVPPGYTLCFKDRDKLNVGLDNLELISRADLCRRNSIHNLPPEIKGAITVLGALKRRVRREEQNRGLARSSFRNAGRPARQRRAV